MTQISGSPPEKKSSTPKAIDTDTAEDVTLQLISLLVLSDTPTSDNPENYEKVFPSDNGATGAQDSTSRTRSTGAARLDGIFADSTARETSFVELRHHDPNPILPAKAFHDGSSSKRIIIAPTSFAESAVDNLKVNITPPAPIPKAYDSFSWKAAGRTPTSPSPSKPVQISTPSVPENMGFYVVSRGVAPGVYQGRTASWNAAGGSSGGKRISVTDREHGNALFVSLYMAGEIEVLFPPST